MRIIHCGDSFTFGVGCENPDETSYASLVAAELQAESINLSRSAGSNYVVYLQVLKAIELKPDFVLINTTSTDRIEWVSDNAVLDRPIGIEQFSYLNVNRPSFVSSLPNYKPNILCDQIYGLQNPRYNDQDPKRLNTVLQYSTIMMDGVIKRDYDSGLIILAVEFLKNAGIPYLVLAGDYLFEHLKGIGPLLYIDFFKLTAKYPDRFGTTHCSEIAHKIVANQVLQSYAYHNEYWTTTCDEYRIQQAQANSTSN
jgi:hypothetical protein